MAAAGNLYDYRSALDAEQQVRAASSASSTFTGSFQFAAHESYTYNYYEDLTPKKVAEIVEMLRKDGKYLDTSARILYELIARPNNKVASGQAVWENIN